MDKTWARYIKKEFGSRYWDEVGTIDDDNESPVMISVISASCFCVPDRVSQYGCGQR